MRAIILVLIAAAALAGCDRVNRNDRIDGPYHLLAENQTEDMSVCYDKGHEVCVARVDATVFAVGFDKDYIVAARHPKSGGPYLPADRSKTEYYYIIRRDDSADAGPRAINGPFREADYRHWEAELHLPPLRDISKEIDWESPPPAKQ